MRRYLAGVVLAGVGLVLSCSGGEQESAKPEAILTATVIIDGTSLNTLNAWATLSAEQLTDPSASELVMNNMSLPAHFDGYDLTYYGDIPLSDTITLSFTSTEFGNATGSVRANQDSVGVTLPTYQDTLPADQDVLVQWTSDGSSDFYWLWVYVEFRDSLWNGLGTKRWTLAITDSTRYIIPKDSLNISGMAFASASVTVEPTNGPLLEPGTQGNLSGDVGGFLHAKGFSGDVWFYVGNPVKGFVPREIKEPTQAERARFLSRLLGYKED